VVSVENSPAIDATRTWTFRVEGIDAAWVQPMVNGNNDWNTTNGTMTFVAYTVDGASEVVSAALVINGVTNSTALVPGLNGTNTITFVTNGMANGAYTADVVSVGINPAITQTNGTVAWSIVEGVAPITLVHHWDFEEGSGTTVADVQGGASWDGAIVGTNHVWISGGLNLLGGGESSNHNPFTVTPTNHAVGSYVNLPNGVMSSLGTGPVTVEATYSATTDWGWMRVWDFGETANGILEEDYATAGGTSFFFASSDWNRAKGAIQTNLTGWVWPEALEMWDYLAWDDQRTEQLTHVVWTFEPGVQTKLYMNGVLADLKLAINWNFTQLNDINNYLGRSQWGPDGMMEGRLYDLRIYTGVMPYGQVIARWNQEKPNPATINPNLQSIGKSAGNVALTWTSEDRVYYNILGRASLGDSWATNKANVLGDPVNTSYQIPDYGDTGFYMIEGVQ